MNREDRALRRLHYVFPDADNIRISSPVDTMFGIVGEKVSTEDDPGQWVEIEDDGSSRHVNFDYLDETIVASGDTLEEFVESALEYKRVESMTQKEYFEKEFGVEIDDDLYQQFKDYSEDLPIDPDFTFSEDATFDVTTIT